MPEEWRREHLHDMEIDCDFPWETTNEDGFTSVMSKKSSKTATTAKSIANKATKVGVRVVRTSQGDSRLHAKDIKYWFSLVAAVDPDAIIVNHLGQEKTAKTVGAMQKMDRMDYNGYMDIHTTPWGHPKDDKTRTTLLFWIASDIISANLKELRQASDIQTFLKKETAR